MSDSTVYFITGVRDGKITFACLIQRALTSEHHGVDEEMDSDRTNVKTLALYKPPNIPSVVLLFSLLTLTLLTVFSRPHILLQVAAAEAKHLD